MYHTYVVLHLLDQTLAGLQVSLFSCPTVNGGWRSWWGQCMLGWFYQSMIYHWFALMICHKGMAGKFDRQFQSLRIKTCTHRLIVKTTIKHEGCSELTSWTFVVHVNLSLPNNQATIIQISVDYFGWNPYMESIEVWQLYSMVAQEQVLFPRGWCTMSVMKTIVEMIYLPPKYWHVEGLSFSKRNWSRQFPQTRSSKSGRSSLHWS
jgi:hypothetical protein